MSKPKTILAIDTVHSLCSAAIIKSNVVLVEISGTKDEKASENILELVDKLLFDSSLDLKDLDSIVVGVGPGNFTGIRVGISAAKGLAFALNIKCFGINRFQTLLISNQPTLSIIKIRENLFYSQMFIERKSISDPLEESLSTILTKDYSNDTIISGDDALLISKKLNLRCGKKTSFSKASELGFLSLKYPENYETKPSPVYIKGPDAKLPKEQRPKIL